MPDSKEARAARRQIAGRTDSKTRRPVHGAQSYRDVSSSNREFHDNFVAKLDLAFLKVITTDCAAGFYRKQNCLMQHSIVNFFAFHSTPRKGRSGSE